MANYAPKAHSISFGGVPIEGFSKGSMVKIVKRNNSVDAEAGIDSFVVFNHMDDPIYDVEISLMAGAASNDYLAAVHAANELVPGSGVLPLAVKNQLGRDFAGGIAAIMKTPDTDKQDSTEAPKVWKFVMTSVPGAVFPGGA